MKLVLVDWVDSEQRDGWIKKDEVAEWFSDMLIVSCGFLIKSTEEYILLTGSIGRWCYNSPMMIPRKAIKKITVVKVLKEAV